MTALVGMQTKSPDPSFMLRVDVQPDNWPGNRPNSACGNTPVPADDADPAIQIRQDM